MEEKVAGKNAIKEAYPVMVSFLDFYFRDRDITKIISMVDENMYFVGAGRDYTAVNRGQFQRLMERENEEMMLIRSGYEIVSYHEEKIGEESRRCLCKAERKEPPSCFIFTALVYKKKEKDVISMLHISRVDDAVVEMAGYIHDLIRESSRDFLTGVYNRKGGEERIGEVMQKGVPFVFLMLDLDDFKKVNDIYGHGAGDSMLCYMGEKLKECFRKTDIIVRLGGDEFAVFAQPCLDISAVKEKVDQLVFSYTEEAKRRYPLSRTSVSVGGIYGKEPESFRKIYHMADQILYAIKQNGKGRCELKEDSSEKR